MLAIADAVDRIRVFTGRDVHLGGYSQGGMLAYEVAAYRVREGVASLVTFGSPVDTREGMPFGVPEQLASQLVGVLAGRGLAGFLQQFIAHNRLLHGGFVVDGRLLTLADLCVPILAVVGALDEIAPAPGVRATPPSACAVTGRRLPGSWGRPLRRCRRASDRMSYGCARRFR